MHALAYDLTLFLVVIFILLDTLLVKENLLAGISQTVLVFLFILPGTVFLENTYYLQFLFVIIAYCYIFFGKLNNKADVYES